jgi:hypothetical protein
VCVAIFRLFLPLSLSCACLRLTSLFSALQVNGGALLATTKNLKMRLPAALKELECDSSHEQEGNRAQIRSIVAHPASPEEVSTLFDFYCEREFVGQEVPTSMKDYMWQITGGSLRELRNYGRIL